MTKNELVTLISDRLVPKGFKHKGNYWVDNEGEISKIVNLQKSQFSNSFYLNYGFVIKQLPLTNEKMHIYIRLVKAENGGLDIVADLMNLENTIPDEERYDKLTAVIKEKLIGELDAINFESDIKRKITDGPWQNITPLAVKHYFGMS